MIVGTLVYLALALTAYRWWLRPLMISFDRAFHLPPCNESDFKFFCWMWGPLLAIMGSYIVWEGSRCLANRLWSRIVHFR